MADRPATYRDIIRAEAEQAGVPPELAFAIVAQESGGRADAVGPDTKHGNARGFFQLIPPTAQSLGVDASDPLQNIQGGIKLLSELNQRYQGDVGRILADYHGGPDPTQHGPKTQAYIQQVLGRLEKEMAAGAPETAGAALSPADLQPTSATTEPSFWERHPNLASVARGVTDVVLPAAGGIAGTALALPGAAAGPAGLPLIAAGAGLGTAAGQGLGDLLEEATGLQPTTTPASKAIRMAGAGTMGAMLPAVPPAVRVAPQAIEAGLAGAGRVAAQYPRTSAAIGGGLVGAHYGGPAGAALGMAGGALTKEILHTPLGFLHAVMKQGAKALPAEAAQAARTLPIAAEETSEPLLQELLKRQAAPAAERLILSPEEAMALQQRMRAAAAQAAEIRPAASLEGMRSAAGLRR